MCVLTGRPFGRALGSFGGWHAKLTRLQMLNAKPAGVTRTGNLLDTAPIEGVNSPGPVTALVKIKIA